MNSASASAHPEIAKLWLIHVAAEIIAAHPQKAPKAKILFKNLLSGTAAEHKPYIQERFSQRPSLKWVDLEIHPKESRTLLCELAGFVTADPPCSRKQFKIFCQALTALNIPQEEHPEWFRLLQLQQVAGKPQIAVQTTHDFIRTCLLDFTEKTGLFCFHRPLVPGVFILIQLRHDCREECYHIPVHATVRSVTKNLLKEDEYLVQAEYQQALDVKHGLPILLNPPKENEPGITDFGHVQSPNRSLKLRHVGCPLCFETRLPFWTLKPHTVLQTRNFFGLPLYRKPYPGYEFCDFHPLRITVCPRCFFASSRLDNFRLQKGFFPQFDITGMLRLWEPYCPELKKTINNLPNTFGTHQRSLKHAVLAYEIAFETLQFLLTLQEHDGLRFEAITLRLIQAELLDQLGGTAEADAQKQKALALLKNPLSEFGSPLHTKALLWRFLLQTHFGLQSDADSSLRQLERLALTRTKELFSRKVIEESLKKARQVSMKPQKILRKRGTDRI